MNIDDMTIGQAKQLASLFGSTGPSDGAGVAASMVGKWVLVRSRNEGINFGRVIAADSAGVVLAEAQRLWYHKPASKKAAWYEGVAKYGPSSDTKVSCVVSEKAIIEDYSMTECTEEAKEMLKELEVYAAS